MVVELINVFNFSEKKTWFLGNDRGLPKFRYHILHNLINTIKL